MATKMTASAILGKYNLNDLQELLTVASCNWLQSADEFRFPVEYPTGLSSQMKDFSNSNAVILAPVVPDAPLNYKDVHQILRELVLGIYILNQVPTIYLDGNYDCSTTCHLSPAYHDTLIGQILINVDYTMKALWHGVYMPTEKRKRFSEIWPSFLDVDIGETSKTEEDILSEFIKAGLIDIATDPDFEEIYTADVYFDPSYDPNSCLELQLFMQYVNDFLLQMNPHITSIKQQKHLFMYDSAYTISNAVRLTEEEIDLVAYQRLQQRLILQQKLVEKYLERKAEVHRNISYLKLIAFLVPFLIALKGKKKVPSLARLLPPISDEKLKTERELPPHLLGQNFKCKHFVYRKNDYFHLHGGIEFDIGTPALEDVPAHIKAAFNDIQTQAMNYLKQLFKPDMLLRGQHTIPIMKFEGQSYYVIAIEVESLLQTFQKVQWWRPLNEAIPLLKSDKLPLNGAQMYEQLMKKFGQKKAVKCKDVSTGLISATKSGLAAVFYTFCQQNPISQLGVVDEAGYSLVHHAAIHNHVSIVCQLTTVHLKINKHRSDNFQNLGPNSLHMAAKCGSLGVLTCLLALRADHTRVDERGWTAMHFAAFYDNVSCIRALYRKDPKFLELETSAEYHSTPLLLAAMAGAFDALQYLLSLGANLTKIDSERNNIVHLSALYSHTEILKYLIEQNIPELHVWKLLKEMMRSNEYKKQEMGVRSLEVLCVVKKHYWKAINSSGSIPALINLLRSKHETLQCISAAVLCNLSTYLPVCYSIITYDIIPVLIGLLHSQQPELQSRCAVILYDIAQIEDNASQIASLGAIPPLVKILNSEVEDVLVNVLKCIRILCSNNPVNQTLVANEGAIPLLVELLSVTSKVLQGDAAVALAEVAREHKRNQDAIVAEGAVIPLIRILSGRKIRMQLKAITAVEVLADKNAAIQKEFLKMSADKHILKLVKVFEIEIREQAATAFWALAGQTLTQRKKMAKEIGYSLVIDLLLSSSDKMHNVACQALIALSECNKEQQDKICAKNGISPLVRLLRSSKISLRTMLSAITALGTMCVGVAHVNNPISQHKITDEGGMDVLLYLLFTAHSLQVEVEVLHSLACIVLGNNELQNVLMKRKGFTYKIVLNHLKCLDKDICLRAASALALFVFNNPKQEHMIREAGGIQMSVFQNLLQSSKEVTQANAAFQMIMLAKVIVDKDDVTLSATGIMVLVNLLKSGKSTTVIVVGQMLSSLTQTRAGISDAIITMGAVEHLCPQLYSEGEQVRDSCATALGYLSFNPTGHRRLLVECRNQPELYELLINNICNDGKISKEFTDEFEVQRSVGLPSERLDLSKSKLTVVRPDKKARLKTASCPHEQKKMMALRSKSAPR
ncbi:ankyrin and armadillo repeat-containing protein isoform X1 [Scyliorhinus canicula]|uniref:ankyrin and armadillo repeat-containing protein isoform X1 n=1 Tax=Scyliorhinus canicula TaxID=7830 RepID=UPI0018F34900|nr:ankyrin and armadillo repeat-containing protein isoform X1 [Scyliorhinus canicula]XP_038645099.1 ankyrin and armadillo repeat-containing protein isoform X1 [Scyliorhinus canicula]